MPRRQIANKRSDFKDPKYNDELVAKFINRMMLHGKKSIAISILYDAIEIANKKAEKEGLEVFSKALANVKPSFEVKSRRVGGSTYQVPVDVRESRGESLAMRWLISAARSKSGKSMSQRLSSELLDAFNSTGSAFKKKEDTHRMADSNKAFAHYKW